MDCSLLFDRPSFFLPSQIAEAEALLMMCDVSSAAGSSCSSGGGGGGGGADKRELAREAVAVLGPAAGGAAALADPGAQQAVRVLSARAKRDFGA